MQINVKIDSAQLILRLRDGERRLAYAVVNAINNTAKRIQAAERQRVEQEFMVRKTAFMAREAAVIKPFASVRQGRAYAEISVGQKPRLLLGLFERGAERRPTMPGAKRVAEPVVGGPARPEFRREVTPALRLRRLRFDRTKTGKRRAAVTATQTYLVPKVGIFQRLGAGAARAVYLFTSGKRLKPRLRWVKTAEAVAHKWFREEMEREVVNAIARARGKGL